MDLPEISSFAQAYQLWENTKPLRGNPYPVYRPLEKRRSKNKVIAYYHGSEQVVCRLYSTDVVSFYRDGRIRVYLGYASKTTQDFINQIIRPYAHINLNYNDGAKPVVWLDRASENNEYNGYRQYKGYEVAGDYAEFDANWKLLNAVAIPDLRIDRKAANKLNESSGFNKFKTWRKMYETMNPDAVTKLPYTSRTWHPNNMPCSEVMRLLADGPKNWVVLAKGCSNDYIAMCCYQSDQSVITQTKKPYHNNWADFTNTSARTKKYLHLR